MCIHSTVKTRESTPHQEDIMISASLAIFAFLLVVAMTAAYPAQKEKMTDRDLIKEAEKDQNRVKVYS